MSFNSWQFIFLFLPATVMGHWILSRVAGGRFGNFWLILASLVFYGWGNPWHLPVLVGSALFNYSLIRLFLREEGVFRREGPRGMLLFAGIAANVGLLVYFKYLAFFLGSISAATGWSLTAAAAPPPLGISFFTLFQIMFLVDAYGDGEPLPALSDYGLFAVFFPYILSGPIVQARDMMPQMPDPSGRVPGSEDLARGIARFAIGLFKKTVIADTLAVWVETGFAGNIQLGFLEAWLVAFCYTLQLYFDFSGYTDMAIGSARMLGFRVPENFNAPFRSTSIIDFWRRWHITLSFFITSYVYMPLVRSVPRAGRAWAMAAVLASMLVSGLWHGAAWTFVLWGAMHGLALVVNHLWNGSRIKLPSGLAWFLTFIFITVAFVCFRAVSLEQAFAVYGAMAGANGIVLPASWGAFIPAFLAEKVSYGLWVGHLGAAEPYRVVIWLLGAFLASIFLSTSEELVADMQPTVESALGIAVCGMLGLSYMFSGSGMSKFLYFQF